MIKLLILTMFALTFEAGSVAAAEETDKVAVAATIQKFLDLSNTGFSSGHGEAIETVVSDQGVVLDDLEPFVWAGPGAFQNWAKAVVASAKAGKIAHFEMNAPKAEFISINGENAYAAAHGFLRLLINGKEVKEEGTLVFVLASKTKPNDSSWKVIGLSWGRTK